MAGTKRSLVTIIISGLALGFEPFPFTPGFEIQKVASLAESLPTHSWEFGVTSEALLELYNPEASVFGKTPFPVPFLKKEDVKALEYAAKAIDLGQGVNSLSDGDGAVGDPASLGVSAVMLGKTDQKYSDASRSTALFLMNSAPRYVNGAISHRVSAPVLWADFVYMAPPFLAYYAVDRSNETILQESVRQCDAYGILRSNRAPLQGAWYHIIGPESQDTGLWSTGNGWAAAGMARVLATVMKAPPALTSTWRADAIARLTRLIMEILGAAKASSLDGGLVRNYLDDMKSAHGFGEISGSSLLASVVYRMAVLQPEHCGEEYIRWADGIRGVLGGNDKDGRPHITEDGIVTPAVNPLGWLDTKPFTTGSPEGQAFVVLMYAAWRDCVSAGPCKQSTAASQRMHRKRFRSGRHL